MRMDSVAWYQELSRFDMAGGVQFRDTTVILNADSASYFLDDERLEAYGNVRLVNLANGTVLVGPNLTYWRAVPLLRDTTELVATDRPVVEYWGTTDSAGVEPYLIVGDTVRLRGNDEAWATGNVKVDRSDFHAAADSAVLALESNAGRLIGGASVRGGGGDSTGYDLRGREVAFTSVDNQLNWIQARDSAQAQSADFTITADTVEFTIVDNQVQGGFAWGTGSRPYAVSSTNQVTADSMAIDSPNQKLEELRSYGSARAVSVRDSLDEEPDWIVGDTLIAKFGETEFQQRYLDTLVAIGTAAAFYRVFDVAGGEVPDINYSRGDQITAVFTVLGLSRVDVRGRTDGVHLQRRRRPQQ
jgi:lipopolysaccharide export system protein LptA